MIEVLIECESGSNLKGVYDETSRTRMTEVTVGAPYPYPYGFVLDTRGDDGDAVDCFLLTDVPIESGSVVEAHPVGLLEQIEDGEVDHKVLAALPESEPILDAALHDRLRSFITAIFRDFPRVRVEVGAILGADEATAFISRHRI